MFEKKVYKNRRKKLKENFDTGLLVFLGNDDSPINYRNNCYRFRQDSNFLYYWGLDEPFLAAIIDIDNDKEIIYGDDPDESEIIWTGEQTSMTQKAKDVGADYDQPYHKFGKFVKQGIAKDRNIRLLPPYRAEHENKISKIFDVDLDQIENLVSEKFIKSIVQQRQIKKDEEILQLEEAIDLSYQMQLSAMEMVKPGQYEYEVLGAMEGIALSAGSRFSFPPIFSIDGEILHNHDHGNQMQKNDILVNDSGAESYLHYASDITRTMPVKGEFTSKQKDIYNIVLEANKKAIEACEPGIKNKKVHLLAAEEIVRGLKSIGIMKGNVKEAVNKEAYALFFPHGIGHMLGLDAHDMENLGEEYVGYDKNTERSEQFGLSYLRLAKKLKPGFTITIEPGIYFIPKLIERWKADNKFNQYINYNKVEEYIDFGGIRIEDNVLINDKDHRVLGSYIPKEVDEIEEICNI